MSDIGKANIVTLIFQGRSYLTKYNFTEEWNIWTLYILSGDYTIHNSIITGSVVILLSKKPIATHRIIPKHRGLQLFVTDFLNGCCNNIEPETNP